MWWICFRKKNFIFICNEDHLKEPKYRMASILKGICPSSKIVGIPPHKLGPIYAVRQAEYLLESDQPVIVNYCDFTCYWDWLDFKKFVEKTECVGSIPAYKGFHPHSLGKNNELCLSTRKKWMGFRYSEKSHLLIIRCKSMLLAALTIFLQPVK